MTLDLDRLKQLERRATPGPWAEIERCDNARDDEACGIRSMRTCCELAPRFYPQYPVCPRNQHVSSVTLFASDAYDECSHPIGRADAAFIAAARTAVPELLALVERLTAERDEARNFFLCTGCGIGAVDEDGSCVTCGHGSLRVIDGILQNGVLDESEAARDALGAHFEECAKIKAAADANHAAWRQSQAELDALRAENEKMRAVFDAAARWRDCEDPHCEGPPDVSDAVDAYRAETKP